ncbi:response regulator, partial [Nodosilinea sp. FACHB-131]|nr:response regulator [Nodosilinea sp. FACHB-131]
VFSDWWSPLFAVNGFIPHGHCYLWKPGLVWLHLLSDLLIGLAYVAISGTLAYLVYKTRREIPFHWMFLAFGSFIVACGSTHFMAVWTLWHPTYWLSGALKVVTAIASVTTAIILPFLVPQALALVESAKLSEERRSHLEVANNQLESLNEQLKEVDQFKTQFFANVSHELRTPLALILGPVEKLLHQTNLGQEHRLDLELVHRNARLLLKQVNDLLDVSKLEAGRMVPTYEQIDVAQLVRLTAANFDGLAEEKQITFTIDAPENLQAQVDGAKVQRILLNLISNAFKFTPNGGTVNCQLTTAHAQDIASDGGLDEESTQSDRIVLSVQDSGAGVPVALRDTIFERFSQGEGGTTRRFGGTGLGLAIAKEFAELQGGTIAVGDAPSGGAQFVVQLPLLAPHDSAVGAAALNQGQDPELAALMAEELRSVPQPDAFTSEHLLSKPLVLVVEDNPEMNRFITTTLASEYRTATAVNGQDGLAQAIALQPDLILSDVMMPSLSGDQMVQQLRTYPELNATPVVMLTAKADDELRVQMLRQGAQDYLTKPFSVEELKARVGNLTALKRVRDRLQQELASQSHDLGALVDEVSLRRRELQVALNALRHQAVELEQANRLKDEFLAIVSHELRTPLNAILGWAQTLQTREFDAATTARALQTIERNARLQTQLIENLLDISRLLRGKLLLNRQAMELKPVIEAAIQTALPNAQAKSIQLSAHLDEAIGEVLGDRDRLIQIIENLLSNAIKFTPDGGQVEIRLEQQLEEVKIKVSDTGQGIRADILPHVFDYFRQADSSTTRTAGGLGLGLAIVQQLVELHDGNIVVASLGEGLGTTFTIYLPLLGTSTPPLYLR